MKEQLPERVPAVPRAPWVSEVFGLSPPFLERWEGRDTVFFVHLLGLERRCEQGIVPSRKNPLPLHPTAGNSRDS